MTSIRRSDICDDMGSVVLELKGDEDQITQGLDWVAEVGVRVDPVSGDVLEG